MAYDSLTSLAKTIDEILIHDKYPFSPPTYQDIKSIHDYSTSMLALLQDSPKEAISLERRMRVTANKAEDTIHFYMSEKNGSNRGGRKSTFKFKRDLRKVAEEMSSIVGEMGMMKYSVTVEDPPLSQSAAAANSSSELDKVVGFENDLMRIKHRLLEEASSELKILPIVGTGGIGKTTLARYVYHDRLITETYDIRAWVTVSQNYRQKDILSNLLVSLGVQREGGNLMSMLNDVYKSLIGRRYLVVMDDVWNIMVRHDIISKFPDDGNGSGIILTSRLLDVAAYVDPHSPPHQMNLLDDYQSWFLLRKNVFGEEDCPHEFELIGKQIAMGCGGLPLSIVIMADLLSSIPMTLDSWDTIAEDVISAISTKDGQLEKAISSSFVVLPHHLRMCMLYMGGFPEDYEFHVSELIKLWIAEGFLKRNASRFQTFEEVAEGYVEDLVNQSLVMVNSRKYNGKIKSCSLHNVVRDFCLKKVQEDKFLLPVIEYLPDTTLRRHFLPQILKNQRRIILTSYDLHLRETIHNSTIRTIICFQQGPYLSMSSVQNFPLLSVLHVVNKSDNSGWEPGQVFELTHLRYLASSIPTSIPAAISKLQNLQTLIIHRHNVCLPEEIWRLTQLRHLIAFSFHPLPHPHIETCPLESLQTLSLASNFECSEMILVIIPYLRKLGICYSEHAFDQDYHLNNLWKFHYLEKLKLELHKDFSFGKLNPVFPVKLKKLTLIGCRLPWNDMTILGSLPILEMLKLRDFAFQGNVWETTEGQFTELKSLLIDNSDLELWITESGHFPVLKHLRLHHCPKLGEIPHDIGEITMLELIEVDAQNGSVVDSAKMIQEEQQYFGIDSFQVLVKHF